MDEPARVHTVKSAGKGLSLAEFTSSEASPTELINSAGYWHPGLLLIHHFAFLNERHGPHYLGGITESLL